MARTNRIGRTVNERMKNFQMMLKYIWRKMDFGEESCPPFQSNNRNSVTVFIILQDICWFSKKRLANRLIGTTS